MLDFPKVLYFMHAKTFQKLIKRQIKKKFYD